MSNYHKIMSDNLNYAISPNLYLELVKDETNKEKRFLILKKYFTENITKNVYQNMDLLDASRADFEQFKKMYIMIAKDLFLNILLAVDTLVSERKCYELDISTDILGPPLQNNSIPWTDSVPLTQCNDSTENEFSICESYLTSTNH